MIKFYFSILFLFFLSTINSQTTTIPDNNFETVLISLGYDDVIDGSVITANISSVTSLDVRGTDISNLTGIEDFIALTSLDCTNNLITNLDVSANIELIDLQCYANNLTSLNVNGLVKLENLIARWNWLTSIDVSTNIVLRNLNTQNNQLICIQVNETQLEGLNSGSFLYVGYYADNGTVYALDCSAALSVSDIDEIQYGFYPNPSFNIIYIKGETPDISISIYDVFGKEVITQKATNQVDISTLKKGIYFVKISDGIKIYTNKLVKN